MNTLNYFNEKDDKLNSKVGKTLTYEELMKLFSSSSIPEKKFHN